MLSDLAVWYLRKRKKSALIGFIVVGNRIQPVNNYAFTCDNHLEDCRYYLANGKPFDIPEGKFVYKVDESE